MPHSVASFYGFRLLLEEAVKGGVTIFRRVSSAVFILLLSSVTIFSSPAPGKFEGQFSKYVYQYDQSVDIRLVSAKLISDGKEIILVPSSIEKGENDE